MIIPGPQATETIRAFLQESCGMMVEHVEFGTPPSGVAIKAHYRDLKGHSGSKAVYAPEARDWGDLEDAVVALSEMLDTHPAARPMRGSKQ